MTVKRISACGFLTGLSVILNLETNDYAASSISTYGVRILVHDSQTYPGDDAETKIVRLFETCKCFLHILYWLKYNFPLTTHPTGFNWCWGLHKHNGWSNIQYTWSGFKRTQCSKLLWTKWSYIGNNANVYFFKLYGWMQAIIESRYVWVYTL